MRGFEVPLLQVSLSQVWIIWRATPYWQRPCGYIVMSFMMTCYILRWLRPLNQVWLRATKPDPSIETFNQICNVTVSGILRKSENEWSSGSFYMRKYFSLFFGLLVSTSCTASTLFPSYLSFHLIKAGDIWYPQIGISKRNPTQLIQRENDEFPWSKVENTKLRHSIHCGILVHGKYEPFVPKHSPCILDEPPKVISQLWQYWV